MDSQQLKRSKVVDNTLHRLPAGSLPPGLSRGHPKSNIGPHRGALQTTVKLLIVAFTTSLPLLKKGGCYPGNMRSENEKIQVFTVPGIKCSTAYMRDSSSSCLECPWWVWQLHHQLHPWSSVIKKTYLLGNHCLLSKENSRFSHFLLYHKRLIHHWAWCFSFSFSSLLLCINNTSRLVCISCICQELFLNIEAP